MSDSESNSSSAEAAAARWMAARDRGFTPAEQDAYLQWLSEDPTHGAEIARLSRAWDRLEALHQWSPNHSTKPNADLLLPRHRRSRWRRRIVFGSALAATLAVVLSLLSLRDPAPVSDESGVIMHPAPRRLTLEDGSLIELNTSARVEVDFTPSVRAVRLVQGEAHFIVAKNPHRPFVVQVGDYRVRAVGTAFNIALAPEDVSVLVTEGEVQLKETTASLATAPLVPSLRVGQEARLSPTLPAGFEVAELSPAEMEARLAWHSLRLEFTGTPLREVIAEFNRYNRRQLVLADAATGNMVIGGTFRADNVEAFVRLLDLGFDIQARNEGDTLVLSRR
ncbi:FecR family protein [Actomonas aquatica]|uniref:FecR domain-containing protein n=1 Tax=Actomonas aquatica TaxID=2866162 RepID=A0ABZ1C6I3_9BACT|nr:FecR domain-containing protein [Opitutus sp. WL0086]WRQ87329.1 FecR domain-containing protein [Opitutus sp. WL0086]